MRLALLRGPRVKLFLLPSVPPERASALLEKVVSVYERAFLDDPAGRTYLEGRGIQEDAALFVRHRVGLAGQRLKEILPSDGKARDELKAIGILLADGSERFAGCVVFPVFDVEGQLTTLYGRRLESSPSVPIRG